MIIHIKSPKSLFRRMTGVGGRPEVVIEIADARGEWQEVEFLYKNYLLIILLVWSSREYRK